jgi:hypothetical protein
MTDADVAEARRVYGGPLNGPYHAVPIPVSSWVAAVILHKVFRFAEADAHEIVNDLIRGASCAHPNHVARTEFTSHRGTRTWLVTCRFAPYVQGSIFEIHEEPGHAGGTTHPG